jgi:hypothetical protein
MRAVLLALFVATVASADEPPAVAAARRRQEALRAVEFNMRVKADKNPASVRLVFDGPKARLEHRITGERPRTFSVASDGERVKLYLLWDNPVRGGSAGTIRPPSEGVCRDTRFLPLTLAARPLDPVHCPFPMDALTPAGTEEIDGRVCDVFTRPMTGFVLPATAWFDPAAGYSLRRFRHGGEVIDVESSNDNSAGVWLTTRYTTSKPNAAGKVEVQEYTVERVEVGKPYPAAEFDPPWPAGLQVYDLVENRVFVSDADGGLQPADNHTVWDWVARLWWVPVAAVGLSAALAGWRVWRKRAR